MLKKFLKNFSQSTIYSKFIDFIFVLWKSSRLIFGPGNCKFIPSCSEYSKTAFKKYGFLKGSFISFKRILRCNPASDGGYDPVP